jgi:hypothetical protein
VSRRKRRAHDSTPEGKKKEGRPGSIDLFCFCVACALSIISMQETKGLVYPFHNPIILFLLFFITMTVPIVPISGSVFPPALREHEKVSWPRLAPEKGLWESIQQAKFVPILFNNSCGGAKDALLQTRSKRICQ